MVLNLTNATGVGGLAKYTNDAVGGILFDGAMVVFFIILIIIYLKSDENPDFESAFTLASFIIFILSTILWIGEFVDGIIPIVFLIFTAFGAFYLYASKR